MATTQEDIIANLQRTIAELRLERNTARTERDLGLAKRKTEYSERIEHQAATIDVLKVMSASPSDPQPVFDQIVRRAVDLCDGTLSALYEYDGALVHLRSFHGTVATAAAASDYAALFPMTPTRGSIMCRAILDRQTIHITDYQADPNLLPAVKALGHGSQLTIPLMREGTAVGAISLNGKRGGFSDSQIELLKTFAEQAVIAINGAETYRALQTRTGDLQESLEYQTATSDVLKVISRSTFDLQPVLTMVAETAARLCAADQAALIRHENGIIEMVANSGFPPEYEARLKKLGPHPLVADAPMVAYRAINERRVVHIHDVVAVPGYAVEPIKLGLQRTSLGVPLLRAGNPIGSILLARQRVEPFTDRQIELVSTFADQAVIAIENTRLLTEQQEALEQQTATAEVLQVINASPGNLAPVYDAMLEKAMHLCGAAFGSLTAWDGKQANVLAMRGFPHALTQYMAARGPGVTIPPVIAKLAETKRPQQLPDVMAGEGYRNGNPVSRAVGDLGGARTILHVPLLKDEAVLGYISVYRQEVRVFTAKQIALLENFASQAVIAMENARLLNELRQRTGDLQESLEYQTATSDVLKVISRSTFDLDPVFQAVVTTAVRLCRADQATIYRYQDGEYRWAAGFGLAPAYERIERDSRILPGTGTLVGRVALQGRTVQIIDAWTDPLYEVKDDARVGGVHTMLGVPLLRDGVPIGVIGLARQRIEPYTERQIALVSTFAEQGVIAIGSVATFQALQERTGELTRSVAELQALEEVLRAVNSSLDLDTVLDTIISRAVQLSQADEGTIYEYDETEEVFVPMAAFGMTVERLTALRERRVRLGETHLGRAAVQRAPVHISDVQQDPSMPGVGELLHGIHAVLAVPLLRDEEVIGGLVIRRRTAGDFAPTIATLLQTFAGQSVVAIENARLFQEARRARATAEVALTDLRRAQANLIQAEKMASLGQLTAGIAHEIKNPLNFVNNFAMLSVELLSELKQIATTALASLESEQRAEVAEVIGLLTSNLEKITEHGKRADGIVKSMLEHSRGASGERRAVDINTLADEALHLAYHGARAQDQSFSISLERDFGEGIAMIEVNPQDITRVLLNLFSNGFYAANQRARSGAEPRSDPTMKVTTRDLGAVIEVRVRDNGIGVPTEIRDKLFEPFFTTKPTGEGTGLGLSITYDIVTKQHGGTITVDSEVDAFTEFVVTLPRRIFATEGGRA